MQKENSSTIKDHRFVLSNFNFDEFSELQIYKHLQSDLKTEDTLNIHLVDLSINQMNLRVQIANRLEETVCLVKSENQLLLSCTCDFLHGNQFLCTYQANSLYYLLQKEEVHIFFDSHLRELKFKEQAEAYGLQDESDLSNYFDLFYKNNAYKIVLKSKQIINIHSTKLADIFKTDQKKPVKKIDLKTENQLYIIVLKKHKYYHHLCVDLCLANFTKAGSLKNSITLQNPLNNI